MRSEIKDLEDEYFFDKIILDSFVHKRLNDLFKTKLFIGIFNRTLISKTTYLTPEDNRFEALKILRTESQYIIDFKPLRQWVNQFSRMKIHNKKCLSQYNRLSKSDIQGIENEIFLTMQYEN